MKNSLMSIADKILLRKRALIETVNDELKNIAQIEHSRHRSFNKTLSKILCKWEQDSVISFFLYLYSVFKDKHKLVHN